MENVVILNLLGFKLLFVERINGFEFITSPLYMQLCPQVWYYVKEKRKETSKANNNNRFRNEVHGPPITNNHSQICFVLLFKLRNEWNDKIICQGNALRFTMMVEIKFIWIQYPIHHMNMIGHQQCHINVIIPSVLCTCHSDSLRNTISSIYFSHWNQKSTKTSLGVGKVPYLAILIVEPKYQ